MKKTKMALTACLLGLFLQSPANAMPEASSWLIRIRALGVLPNETSTITPIGGSVKVSDTLVPELDLSYFFTDNIAAELILATTKHKMRALETAVGEVNVGSVWLLPPTLTLQYHFTQLEPIKPYVGAGINYTFFYSAKHGAMANVDYDNKASLALQAGIDIPLCDNFYINMDVKKLFLKTTASFNNRTINADVDIKPWLVGAGIGYRF